MSRQQGTLSDAPAQNSSPDAIKGLSKSNSRSSSIIINSNLSRKGRMLKYWQLINVESPIYARSDCMKDLDYAKPEKQRKKEAEKHADVKSYYSEIFNLPHWEPEISHGRQKHPRMPMEKRAAIFASFDALSGYKDATVETARTTEKRMELSETEKKKPDQRLMFLIDRMEEGADNGMMPGNIISADRTTADNHMVESDAPAIPPVTITYFSPDALKDGGEYRSLTGIVKKIDLYERTIMLDSGQIIRLNDIINLTGEMFTGLDGY